jgi:hypothetical protein
MNRIPPTPVLDSARVAAYAFVDDIPYRRCGRLIVDGVLLEHVPRLAICFNLGEDIGAMLLHCDSDWNVLGVSGANTMEDAKVVAERNYPGVAARWINLDISVEAALEYYDAKEENTRCSFCGKRPFEFKGGCVEGTAAVICGECIETYHRELYNEP